MSGAAIKSTGISGKSSGPVDQQSGQDYNDRPITAKGGPLMDVGSGPAEYTECKTCPGVTGGAGSAKMLSGAQTMPGGPQA